MVTKRFIDGIGTEIVINGEDAANASRGLPGKRFPEAACGTYRNLQSNQQGGKQWN